MIMPRTMMYVRGQYASLDQAGGRRRGSRLVQDLALGDALSVGRPGDVLEFRCRLHNLAILMGQLDRDSVAVHGDLGVAAQCGVFAHCVVSSAERGAFGVDSLSKFVGEVGLAKHAQGVGWAALLHQDRGEPCIGGTVAE